MKKLISLLICIVIVLGIFAGCNNNADPKDTGADGTGGGTTNFPVSVSDSVAVGSLPLVPAGKEATISIGIMQNVNTENYDTNSYTLWLEEQTGINLEFVYFSNDKTEATQQLNTMIGGGEELPDILWGFSGMDDALRSELGNDDYLVDLTDYFEEYGHWFWEAYNKVAEIDAADQERIFQYGKDAVSGAMYAYPAYVNGTTDNCICGFINTAWLEELDMKMPTTIDELYDVLVAFKTKDPNGNGKADEIPLIYEDGGYRCNITEWIINAYVYCNDNYFFNATDGDLWVPYTTDEYREALKFMNKLYEEGLFSPLSWTMENTAEMKALVTPDDGNTICGVVGGHPVLVMTSDNEAILDYTGIAPLKDETGKGGYGAMWASTFTYNTSITTDCDDPVLAFRLLDFMNSIESINWQRYGRYGEDWEWAPEGNTSQFGLKSVISSINGSVYSTQNNYCWHVVNGVVRPTNMWCGIYTEEGKTDVQIRHTMISTEIYNNTVAAGAPDEVVYTLVYNEDENETVSEVKTSLKDHVKESRALFISGAMDPNSDADWQKYLNELESMGLSDYLDDSQSAYERMTAK